MRDIIPEKHHCGQQGCPCCNVYYKTDDGHQCFMVKLQEEVFVNSDHDEVDEDDDDDSEQSW